MYQIYLIRHAKPILTGSGLFSKAQAQQYLQDYKVAEVEKIIKHNAQLPLDQIETVFCSPLPRAKVTAQMLFGPEAELVEDAMFLEFENRIWGLPWGKFPLAWWQVTSRILWLLGLNQKRIENFKQAKLRAARAAAFLADEAGKKGIAVLVAHGFLNTFIKRSLQRQGWKVTRDGGRGYLGVTLLEKQR